MLEAFSKKCVKDATTIVCECDGILFEAKGSVVKQAGWRAVFGETDDSGEEENGSLPDVRQDETFKILKSELLEKQTKPKPIHTEASLLAAMENAGKEVENEAEREAIKDCGIGTPATRAAIIETLFSRDYIRREKKSLVPTEKGLSVYETVKDMRIADVSLTGSWEDALSQIERGKMQPETFKHAIEIYTKQVTAELLNASIASAVEGEQAETLCPKCKKAQMRFYPKVAKCTNPDCGLVVFRNKSGKDLTDKQITELLTTGKTSVIKGFKSKEGKIFDAALNLNENFQVTFVFAEKSTKKGKKQ
jgi:DNA topoisomerase-3